MRKGQAWVAEPWPKNEYDPPLIEHREFLMRPE